jgi:hypothetical protein
MAIQGMEMLTFIGGLCCVAFINSVGFVSTTDCNDKRLTDDRPDLSSERAPQIRQDCNLKKKQKNISGQKSQIGLDTKTY